MSAERIYLDHAAGGALLPAVQKEMLRYLVGNQASPGGGHREGREAREELEKARQRVATFLGAKDVDGVIFTSGGTEAVQSAINTLGSHLEKISTRPRESLPKGRPFEFLTRRPRTN